MRDFGYGWMCSCPDHMYTAAVCKHIQTVQWDGGKRRVIQAPDETVCKFCDSEAIILKGTRNYKRRFRCKTCNMHFTQNLGFERKRHAPEHVTVAVEMMYAGLSSRKAAKALRRAGYSTSHTTVQRWVAQYGDMMEWFLAMVVPLVGELWRTDEVYLRVLGRRKYLFAMLDSETRYWIARMVATHKGTDDVRPMFRQAKKVADKVPSKLRSDGAANFAEAHKDEYAPRNFLWKDSVHESHIRMDGDTNNNQMESFNGNTIRLREKVVRGLKKEDSAILAGLQIYHNHVRPHLGLPDGQTPSEAAGIHIVGADKLLMLIRASTKAQAKAGTEDGT